MAMAMVRVRVRVRVEGGGSMVDVCCCAKIESLHRIRV
jgi:hypothetical protein